VKEYSSKIILYFQIQNHEYFYSGVSIVLCIGLPAPSPSNTKFTILIYTNKQINKYLIKKKKSMFMSVQTCANHGNRTITEIEQGVTGSMSDAQAPTGQKQ